MEVWIYVDNGDYSRKKISIKYKDKVKLEEQKIKVSNKKASCQAIIEEDRVYIFVWNKNYEWLGQFDNNNLIKILIKIIKNILEQCVNKCNRGQIAIRHHSYKNQSKSMYTEFEVQNGSIQVINLKWEETNEYNNVRNEVLKFFNSVYHFPEGIYTKEELSNKNIPSNYSGKVWICVISNDFAVGRENWKAYKINDRLLFAVEEHPEVIDELKLWEVDYSPKSLYLVVHEPFFQAHKEDIEKMSSLHISFHHIPSTDPVYEAIRSGDVQKIINLILKKILTLLLHRIAHLFLPIDIDLMGICEVLRDDFEPPQSKTKEKWAEEYYNEAFNDTSPQKRFKELCEQAKNEIESMKLDDDKKQKILQMLCDNKNLGLPDKPDIAKFKDWAKNPEENPFHQWFREVMEVMEELKRI